MSVVEALRVEPPNHKASQNGRVNADAEEYVPQVKQVFLPSIDLREYENFVNEQASSEEKQSVRTIKCDLHQTIPEVE